MQFHCDMNNKSAGEGRKVEGKWLEKQTCRKDVTHQNNDRKYFYLTYIIYSKIFPAPSARLISFYHLLSYTTEWITCRQYMYMYSLFLKIIGLLRSLAYVYSFKKYLQRNITLFDVTNIVIPLQPHPLKNPRSLNFSLGSEAADCLLPSCDSNVIFEETHLANSCIILFLEIR